MLSDRCASRQKIVRGREAANASGFPDDTARDLEDREIFFKPYRLVYRVVENDVYVFLIADGRRDMQTRLQWRLLQG